jgi:hypothetical protein
VQPLEFNIFKVNKTRISSLNKNQFILGVVERMEKDFDALIKEQQSELVEAKKQMEETKSRFINSAIIFMKQWFEKNARDIVTSDTEKSASLPNEKLAVIKQEVKGLVETTDDLVRSKLERDFFWWHLQENDKSYPTYQHSVPDFITDELKFIMGNLGQIFLNHGFIKIEPESNTKISYDDKSPFVITQGKPKYRYALVSDQELTGVIQQYGKLHEKAKSILSAIEKFELEKKKNNIGDIWDSL